MFFFFSKLKMKRKEENGNAEVGWSSKIQTNDSV